MSDVLATFEALDALRDALQRFDALEVEQQEAAAEDLRGNKIAMVAAELLSAVEAAPALEAIDHHAEYGTMPSGPASTLWRHL